MPEIDAVAVGVGNGAVVAVARGGVAVGWRTGVDAGWLVEVFVAATVAMTVASGVPLVSGSTVSTGLVVHVGVGCASEAAMVGGCVSRTATKKAISATFSASRSRLLVDTPKRGETSGVSSSGDDDVDDIGHVAPHALGENEQNEARCR